MTTAGAGKGRGGSGEDVLCRWEREKDMAGQIGIYYRMDWGPLGGKDMGQETKAGGWTDWLGGRRGRMERELG